MFAKRYNFSPIFLCYMMNRNRRNGGEFSWGFKSCNHPCFQIQSWRFKIRFFLVHKHSNVKKSRPYILSLRDRKSFYASQIRCPWLSPFPWPIRRILAISETKESYVTSHTIKFFKSNAFYRVLKRLRHVAMALNNSVLNKLTFQLKWRRYLSHGCFLSSRTKKNR